MGQLPVEAWLDQLAWVAMPARVPTVVDPAVLRLLTAWWMPLAAFVWGTLWGSFANVVIWRVPRGQSVVRPGSRCGACGQPIRWFDNLPVISYLMLRGRCRACDAPISLRYMVVELAAGMLSFALYRAMVVVPLLEGGGIEGVAAWQLWFVFCLALIVVTYTDLDLWVIPDAVVLPVAALGLVVAAVEPELAGVSWREAAGAAATGYAIVATIRWVYLRWRGIEAMGLGDGKLLLMIGAFCGFPGLLWALGAGATQSLLIAVPMLMFGRGVANSDLQAVHGDDPLLGEEDPDAGIAGKRIPFGPFLALAALEFVLLRPQLERLFEWFVQG
ncbi:MAG: prepilin peptidase [Myxococcales bacterium FL481]|nr:MAG: prepilin peptidase [Myxococcales bacterium FL481]